MPLLKLPNELLLHVARYFNHDCDINSLAQTTKLLHHLLKPCLYRHNVRYGDDSALEWALHYGHVTVARKMLEAGANLYEYLHEDWHPLVKAWIYGPDAAVKFLQEKGDEGPVKGDGEHTIDRLSLALTPHPEVMLRCVISIGKKSPRSPHLEMCDCFSVVLMNEAVTSGDLEAVKLLIERFPGIINGDHHEDSYFRPPMSQAASKGRKEIIRFLLDAGANPNIASRAGETPLYYAVKKRDIEAIQLLLDNGAHVDPRVLHHSDQGWHSLITLRLATRKTAIAKLLLQHIDIEEKMKDASLLDRDTLMVASAACGFTAIVKQILDREIHGDTKPWGSRTFLHWNDFNKPPLFWAVSEGHKDIVKLLLDYGANQYERKPVLPIAIAQEYTEIAELLLARGTDFNLRSCAMSSKTEAMCTLGICTLSRAIKFPPTFQSLLERGALVQDDPRDLVSLMADVVRSGNVALVQMLLEKGVPLQVHELSHPEVMLDCAVKGGIDMLNFLTTHSVLIFDPNDDHVKNILWDAVAEGRSEIAKYFLDRGCDPNSKLEYKRPPIDKKAKTKDREAAVTFDTMWFRGADISQISKTSGDFFSEDNQLNIIHFVLERGANPHPVTSTWIRSALWLAVHRNYRKVLHLLLQAMCSCGTTLSDLRQEINILQKKMFDQRNLQATIYLDHFYWRKKYPVP